MLFNSTTFFYFIALVLLLNYLLPFKFRNGMILAFSFLFYASWSPIYIFLLLATAGIDYQIALKIDSKETKEQKKPWLWASIIFSIGSLLYFKYTMMALSTSSYLLKLFGVNWTPPGLEIILPLGISFYTFETISYTIDVYRGDLKPKKSFIEYLTFLMFFPKLIAGPIVRASELLYQIPKHRTCTPDQLRIAFHEIAIGFGKKILISDNFAPYIEKVFSNPSSHNRYMILVAMFGYSMQVYLDFSAYSDLARGFARLLGFELPQNFNRPYLAVSISDFWRRWHMTLSRWFRDYLYIPLGGNHTKPFRNYLNLFTVMLVGGLWHGSNWTFVAWGALNGAFLVIEKIWYDLQGKKPKRETEMKAMEKAIRIVIVFSLITLTRVFFRSENFNLALEMFQSLIRPSNFEVTNSFAFVGIPTFSLLYIYLSRYKSYWMAKPLSGVMIPFYAIYFTLLLLFGASQAEFIYFQF